MVNLESTVRFLSSERWLMDWVRHGKRKPKKIMKSISLKQSQQILVFNYHILKPQILSLNRVKHVVNLSFTMYMKVFIWLLVQKIVITHMMLPPSSLLYILHPKIYLIVFHMLVSNQLNSFHYDIHMF